MVERTIREDGYVKSLNSTQLREVYKKIPQAVEAIQYLEDGLSYLNYAKPGSDRGTNNTEEDYKIGIDFIMSALDTLRDKKV